MNNLLIVREGTSLLVGATRPLLPMSQGGYKDTPRVRFGLSSMVEKQAGSHLYGTLNTRLAATHEVAPIIWGTDVLDSRRPPLRLVKRVRIGRFAFAPAHFACRVGVRNMQ